MRFVGLISGGKDSFFSIFKNIKNNHILVGLLYIHPIDGVGDSYMYQSVGFEIIKAYSQCINIPLFIEQSKMLSKNISLDYEPTIQDEVEDLYLALKKLQKNLDFEAVSSGAIASNYQRNRIQNVCNRLKIKSLTPLWGADQRELLKEMIDSGISARIVKIANPCLPLEVLGMSLIDFYNFIKNSSLKYFNLCGEGGEYETICEDVPFFKKSINILNYEIVCDSGDKKASSAFYMKIKKWTILEKIKD